VQHALAARESGRSPVILFNLSGHGLFDLAAYDAFLRGAVNGGTVTA
jgi:tryptophan synthase beta chain